MISTCILFFQALRCEYHFQEAKAKLKQAQRLSNGRNKSVNDELANLEKSVK
jgi:hypothetical protein